MKQTGQPNLAAALGRVPSGLFILTASDNGHLTGMLASWVQQCSFEPPQVSVAVKPGRYVADLLTVDSRFAINQIATEHKALIGQFAKGFGPGEPAFAHVAFELSERGVPLLSDALASLECTVMSRTGAGDHDLIVARVWAGQLRSDASPYVHIRKNGLTY